jgi:tetraacyldisaccharide 4'-kinase
MSIFEKTRSRLFFYVKEIIDNKRKNIFFEVLLFLLSLFYSLIIFFKNLLYDLKIFKGKKVKCKVISIGNIDCGGVGKSPFTIYLASKFISNKKIAIVTRGYKSKYENKSLYISKNSNFDVFEIGDEPFLFKNHIKDISIFIGKNKLLSAKKASDLNYDMILIDDGFQYRKLKKDLEIVILDANKPFYKNKCLPRGLLRESPKGLKRADFIIINNANKEEEKLENEIKKYTNSPIIYTKVFPNRFLDFSKKIVNINQKAKVAVFCGIANPSNFFKTINEMNLDIVNQLELLDHEVISHKKLDEFIFQSLEKKAQYIITTEKDFVKLSPLAKTALPIVYLEIILNIVANKYNSQTLVEKINNLFNN